MERLTWTDKDDCIYVDGTDCYMVVFDCVELYAGEAVVKLSQYEDLGTPEELQEAKEKQIAKKPVKQYYGIEHDGKYDACPICGNEVFHSKDERDCDIYCDKCGQKLDWN